MTAFRYSTHITALQGDTAKIAEADNKAPGTGDSVPEYWVTRVVRQMKGCSPSKIDSVIQANLGPRRIRWSQRPDTLEIPGLEGRTAYTVDNLPLCYELGFFKDNALLHPEITVRPQGIAIEAKPQHPKDDGIIGTIIILCFVLLSIILHNTRHFISVQSKEFFHPTKQADSITDNSNSTSAWNIFLANLLLATIASTLFFYYAESSYNLFLCHIPKHWLLGIYTGAWLAVFGFKRIMTAFINWIFFDKTSRQQWRHSYNFLLILECTILLPTVAFGIYFNLVPEMVLFLAVLIISVFKLVLLYKTYTTFLFKIYCILHLLSYLCALEIIPLLALWAILTGITDCFTLTF